MPGKCIDSDTMAMTPNTIAGQTVQCGNCGKDVPTYARRGDGNLIPMLAAHSTAK